MTTLRVAVPGDEAAVAAVHVRAWQAAYRGIFDDAFLDGLEPEGRMQRYRFGADGPHDPATALAEDDGRVLGFVSYGPGRDEDAQRLGEVYALYVDPDRGGRGVGRALMARAQDDLVARGYDQVILWVLTENVAAQRFYRADRWRPDGGYRREDVWDVPAVVLRMRRWLA